MDPFLGEIRIFAGSYAPNGWAICDGSMLKINQNFALFTLLGNTYGGNGITTFALPDLRGRLAVAAAPSPEWDGFKQGEQGGSETVQLSLGNQGTHSHFVKAANVSGHETTPTNNLPGQFPIGHGKAIPTYAAASSTTVGMATQAIGLSPGIGVPHSNIQPSLAMTYIISLQGLFPQQP